MLLNNTQFAASHESLFGVEGLMEAGHPTLPATGSPLRRARRRWFVSITLLISSLAAIVIVEGSCRLLGLGPATAPEARVIPPGDLHPVEFIREAQLKHWLHPPNQVTKVVTDEHPAGTILLRRNNCGFREDQPTPIERGAGVYRIMVLGDSHTDGVCLNDESYANVLERLLNQSRGTSAFDVINAGHSTFSPYQEWWLYEQVGRYFSPNMVIVGFYSGNDYWDLMRQDDRVHLRPQGDGYQHVDPADHSTTSEANDSPQLPAQTAPGKFAIQAWLRNHTATYSALAGIPALRGLFIRLQYSPVDRPIQMLTKEEASGPYWQSLGQAYYFAHHAEDLEQADKLWGAVLQRLRDSTKRDGVKLLILLLPTLREIAPETDLAGCQSTTKILGLSETQAALDSEVADRAVRQAQHTGVNVIDLRPEFRESHQRNPERRLFYRFDHHLSPAGHQLVAEILAKRLHAELLPSETQ